VSRNCVTKNISIDNIELVYTISNGNIRIDHSKPKVTLGMNRKIKKKKKKL